MTHALLLVCLFLLTSGTSLAAETKTTPAPQPKIHGHRGARARLPENTLPAFEYALKLDVDYLEMDMAVTKDGVIVLSHEPRINAEICLDEKGEKLDPKTAPLIHELTLAQVQSYDCGSLKNPRFPDQRPKLKTRIPRLAEVFALVKNSKFAAAQKVGFNIETKIDPTHPEYTVTPEAFVELALSEFKNSGFLDRIVLQSFDPRTLVIARQKAPTLARSILVENPDQDLVKAAEEVSAKIVSPDWTLLTPELALKLHEKGFEIHPWTANDRQAWTKLLTLKVDGIITDDPEGLKKFLSLKFSENR